MIKKHKSSYMSNGILQWHRVVIFYYRCYNLRLMLRCDHYDIHVNRKTKHEPRMKQNVQES